MSFDDLGVGGGVSLSEGELERLDSLVSEYLLFRSFKQTQAQLFLDKRLPSINKEVGRQQRTTVQRLLNALDNGDYPRMVALWDSFITARSSERSKSLSVEMREVEFLVHLTCAVYPFRSEIIQIAGSPAVAAKVAARSMTIFKHYLETRGSRCSADEFVGYRNIHKIAFPPAHPQYKHMFTPEWSRTTRNRIASFLEKFFTPSNVPVLCHLFERLGTKTEGELKEIFRRRERKLLKFARSVHTLSSDLLSALEAGKSVDKAFLISFRNRFNTFEEVMRPDEDFEQEMGGADTLSSPPAGFYVPSVVDPASPTTKRPPPARPTANAIAKASIVAHKIADLGHLDYASMSRDVAFMSSELAGEISGLLTKKHVISPADAAVKCEISMHGCVLLHALVQYVLRPDKEVQSKAARDSAVTALCRADILGLRSATTQASFVDISSGSIGLESRSVTRFMFALAEATKRIPETVSVARIVEPGKNSSFKVPSYEKLLQAGELVAEYAGRLITALCTSPIGVSYLHTFGVRITAAFADLLVAFPSSLDAGGQEVGGWGEKEEEEEEEKKKEEEEEGGEARHRRGGPGIQTWCLMALILLTGQSKTNQVVVLKRGVISWLSKTLGRFVGDAQQELRALSEDPNQQLSANNFSGALPPPEAPSPALARLFDMAVGLLRIIVNSPEAQRYLVGSVAMQRETESLISVLNLLLIVEGRSEYHVNILLTTLQVLLKEATTREIVAQTLDTALLRRCIEQRTTMSIDVDKASELLQAIESTAPTVVDEGRAGDDNLEAAEILESVLASQAAVPDNPIFLDYSSGMARLGVPFLLRYSSSAGRLWFGEEQPNSLEEVPRISSPPIHAQRVDQIVEQKPKVPRTPPRGGNARAISHGKEFDDEDDEVVKKKDEEEEEEEEEEEKEKEEEEDEEKEEEGEEEEEEEEQEEEDD